MFTLPICFVCLACFACSFVRSSVRWPYARLAPASLSDCYYCYYYYGVLSVNHTSQARTSLREFVFYMAAAVPTSQPPPPRRRRRRGIIRLRDAGHCFAGPKCGQQFAALIHSAHLDFIVLHGLRSRPRSPVGLVFSKSSPEQADRNRLTPLSAGSQKASSLLHNTRESLRIRES